MKKNVNQIVLGIVILICGVVYLGNTLDIWNFDIFFEGWWTLFIIVPSFVELITNRDSLWSSLIGIIIGILLLIASRNVMSWDKMFGLFFPILIIILGLSLIFNPRTKKFYKKGTKFDTSIGVFGGVEQRLTKVEDAIKAIAVFGGVELDLRDVKLDKDIDIDCTCVFGGIDIYLPDGVEVKVNGMPFFGGLENKYRVKEKNKYVVNINYLVAFGGIDIK